MQNRQNPVKSDKDVRDNINVSKEGQPAVNQPKDWREDRGDKAMSENQARTPDAIKLPKAQPLGAKPRAENMTEGSMAGGQVWDLDCKSEANSNVGCGNDTPVTTCGPLAQEVHQQSLQTDRPIGLGRESDDPVGSDGPHGANDYSGGWQQWTDGTYRWKDPQGWWWKWDGKLWKQQANGDWTEHRGIWNWEHTAGRPTGNRRPDDQEKAKHG